MSTQFESSSYGLSPLFGTQHMGYPIQYPLSKLSKAGVCVLERVWGVLGVCGVCCACVGCVLGRVWVCLRVYGCLGGGGWGGVGGGGVGWGRWGGWGGVGEGEGKDRSLRFIIRIPW